MHVELVRVDEGQHAVVGVRLGAPPVLVAQAARLAGLRILHEFAQALKHLVLLRRLAEIVGACEVVADPAHPALRPLPPLLLGDPAPIALRFAADPWLARSLRSLWLRRRAASTPRGAGLGDRPRGAIGADPGRIRAISEPIQ